VQKFVFSQFWRIEVQDGGVWGVLFFSEATLLGVFT
jgi:hypothetical protein